MNFLRRACGFTIIELMLVIAFLAILTTLAAPNLSTFLQARQSEARASKIVDAFSVARMQAISKAESVSVCWNSGTSDLKVPPTGANADSYTLAPGELGLIAENAGGAELIRKIVYVDDGFFVEVVNPLANDCVTYDSYGRGPVGVDITFGVCRSEANTEGIQTVAMAATGRVSVEKNNPEGFDCK